jgi:MFS family permease
MEEQNLENSTSAEQKNDSKSTKRKNKFIFWISGLVVLIIILLVLAYFLLPKPSEIEWFSNRMIAIYIAVGVIAGGVLACFLFRKPLRTRLRMQKALKEDPDINDWLVIFQWTPKILYVPTIVASFIAAAFSCFQSIPEAAIGGIWFAVFFLNFLIEEYNISIKILLITIVSAGFFLLWLHLLGWVWGFFGLFKHIAVSMNTTVYLLVGIIGLLAILFSWLKGLFYYMSITPNYMNIQEGPTESGEQIGREDYNSRIDTSDFLERIMGFGRIIITFKDRKREPIAVLVWRIQKKAQMLESVRAKFAIDHQQQINT